MSERRQKIKERDDSPLFSHKSESVVVGEALQNQEFFWGLNGRLKSSHFTVPRLARIWEAMIRAAEKGRPPTKTWVPAFIQNDSGEEHPLLFFLNLLINDAAEERDSLDIHAQTVMDLASTRAILDAMDHARNRIMKTEFGARPEHLQDMAMKMISGALDADADSNFRSYSEYGMEVWREVAASLDAGEDGGLGLPCGLRAVEEVWGRLLPGKLYMLAGVSGHGKSAIAEQIAEAAGQAAALRKMGIGYVASYEMTGKDYATRALAKEMGISSDLLERGAIDRAQVESLYARAKNLSRFNLYIDTKTDCTIDELGIRMNKARIQKGGLAFAVIDHLIIMAAEKGEGLYDKIARSTLGAKNLAKKLNIPIILLAQVDEAKLMLTASKWPNTNHLFGGSNTIKQNADSVAFIHRPEEILRKSEPPKGAEGSEQAKKHDAWVQRMDRARGKAHFFNDKRRSGAGGVSRELRWFGETTHFEDI